MKRIYTIAALLAGSVCLSVQAAENHHSTTSTSPMQQDYQRQMDKMHEGMMAGMKESNPDRAFAVGMLAHHKGAVDMAQSELKYGTDPKMRALAEEIIKAQQAEIDLMETWLKEHPAK